MRIYFLKPVCTRLYNFYQFFQGLLRVGDIINLQEFLTISSASSTL